MAVVRTGIENYGMMNREWRRGVRCMRVGVSSFLSFDITGFAPGRTNAGWPDAGWRVHRHYVYHLLVFLPKYVFGSPWLVSRLSMMDLYFLSDSSASSCSCSSNFRLWSRVTSLATICA